MYYVHVHVHVHVVGLFTVIITTCCPMWGNKCICTSLMSSPSLPLPLSLPLSLSFSIILSYILIGNLNQY